MSFDSLLNLTCDIELNTPAQNANTGQFEPSWADAETGIPCRLDPKAGGVTDVPEYIFDKTTHILFMRVPATTILVDRHRIEVGTSKYNILLVKKLYGPKLQDHLEILLELVT